MSRLILLCFFFLYACSSAGPSKKMTNITPPHGGVLLKGKDYHVEIVSKDKKVEIYTLQEMDHGKIKVIPTEESDVYARYSPDRSKANWGLHLTKDQAKYMGEVDPKGENAYQIYVDLKVGKKKEKFFYTIVMK